MKKIIIIQLSRMGDVILSMPLLQSLKHHYPGCHITLICYREFTDILLNSNVVDRFLRISIGDIAKLAKINHKDPDSAYPELAEEYDLCINLAYDIWPAQLCSHIMAKTKYGRISSKKEEVRLLGDWMKYLFSIIHSRDYNLFNLADLFTRCGGVKSFAATDYLQFTEEQVEEVKTLLAEKGYTGGTLIAFQLGASEKRRIWDITNFVQLGRLLKSVDSNLQIVLLGSKHETSFSREFLELAEDYSVIDLIGQGTIHSLAALISQCSYLISNDTGPIHVAAAVGTPVICISFGSAYYAETGPYGNNHYVIQSELPCQPCVDYTQCEHMDCRKHITVEAVFEVAKEVLYGKGDAVFDFPQLSIYRSHFLENGTLIYLPVFRKEISTKFQKGLLYRIIWEPTREMNVYREFIQQYIPEIFQSENFKNLLTTFMNELNAFSEIFRVGIAACDQLLHVFASGNITQEAITTPVNRLNIIETFLDKREEPLSPLKHFFSFEIMDMEFAQFPVLAEQLREKYQKLVNRVASSLTNLQYIQQSEAR